MISGDRLRGFSELVAAQEGTFGVTSLPHGRSFCLGPDWSCSDGVVLFDRNSGDYWVVSRLAGLIIKLLQINASMSLVDFAQELAALTPGAELMDDLLPTLRNLTDNHLVQTSSRSTD